MKGLLFFLTLILIYSCGSVRKLDFYEVDSIGADYNETKPITFNSVIPMKFFANAGGKEIDLSNRETFEVITTNGIVYDKAAKALRIDRYANSFQEDRITVTAVYSNPENLTEQRTQTFTFPINFDQPLVIDYSGENGEKGENGKNRNTRLIGRDGNHGDNGNHGGHGTHATPVEVYIWRENAMLYAVSVNQETGVKSYHKTLNQQDIKIFANGGRGGDGGNGGDGGDGGDGNASSRKAPGNAGNGGIGGDGGNGGDGAKITVYFHDPSSVDLLPNCRISNAAGIGGSPGNGGERGQPGDADNGQSQARSGTNGTNGLHGITGRSGEAPVIQALAFNIEEIKL